MNGSFPQIWLPDPINIWCYFHSETLCFETSLQLCDNKCQSCIFLVYNLILIVTQPVRCESKHVSGKWKVILRNTFVSGNVTVKNEMSYKKINFLSGNWSMYTLYILEEIFIVNVYFFALGENKLRRSK